MPRREMVDEIEEVLCPHCDGRGWLGPRDAPVEQRRRCGLCSGTKYVAPVVRDSYILWSLQVESGDSSATPTNPLLVTLARNGESPLTRETILNGDN